MLHFKVIGQLLTKENCSQSKTNPNLNPNPKPNWGAIFLEGNCPDTAFYLYILLILLPLKIQPVKFAEQNYPHLKNLNLQISEQDQEKWIYL